MSAQGSEDSAGKLASRTRRLHAELSDEEVPLTDPDMFPTGLRREWPRALDVVCEEIVHARYVEVHEGYRPSYGCVLVPALTDIGAADGITLAQLTANHETPADSPLTEELSDTPWLNEDVAPKLRQIIDGSSTFLIRDLDGRFAFGTVPAADELALLELSRALSGVCIQRLGSGRIQVLTTEIVCVNDNFDWRWLTTASEILPKLIATLEPPSDMLEDITVHLGELLDLCVHLLSPRGIGATVVWRISAGPSGAWSNQPTTPPVRLNFFDKRDRSAIVALLATVDGACVVARDGALMSYWAMLDPSTTAKELVTEQGGTRHTSAKRYSYDEPGSLVVVVSADGPVSVFSDGARLVRLADAAKDRGREWMTRLALDDAAQIAIQAHRIACQRCDKQIHIDIDTHPAATDTVSVSCPVCATTPLATYENVVRSKVWVAKDWPGIGSASG
ncbi:DNA integrity scanning protein DisA nucleotide-binding domain protein [Mycolicibacterium neoaurum]|uniref:DNA integrity scanning protein DisA nucleotide-binding domain protein n=1 Tax=Mycolicibacterium neoaurum TaxID=1795 RepID=UPI0026741F10|nr:DNA integrity scanning protein DisA nucleotide-binding domain protein [Mycolicibacterium neoaurum]MDO3401372.1 DNA integrity scanning protein DisA nucleotide-binding domain protein [Mycolicibacterium neoaurum]